MFCILWERKAGIVCFLSVLATYWLPSTADPLVVSSSTFPVQALRGIKYAFYINFELGWSRAPSGDFIYYRVSEDNSGIAELKNVSAYNENGTLVTSLSVVGAAEHTGERGFTVAIMTEEDGSDAQYFDESVFVIPPVLSLLPPLVIIFLAVTTKSVLLSLSGGIYSACFIEYKYNIFQAFLRFWDVYVIPTMAVENNLSIYVLNFFLAGMIGVILKNGGGFGAAKLMSEIAKNRRNAALATFLLGLVIMFHTYANALIIGQSMRPLTDMYLISREKLAFLVDSTSAPIASVSPISSWIGYELSLIDGVLNLLRESGEDVSCYDQSSFVIFVKTILRRYYPWGVLLIQLVCILSEREFGPMLFAERRAKSGKGIAPPSDDKIQEEIDQSLNPNPDTPLIWWMAFWPVVAVIFFTVFFLCYTGAQNSKAVGDDKSIQSWFGNSDSNMSLVYSSFIASILAFLMSRLIGHTKDGKLAPIFFTRYFTKEKVKPFLTFTDSLWAWVEGMKGILSSMIILALAWAVGTSFQGCNTSTFISSAASDSIDPRAFPAMSFFISGMLSSITGTSWGTMAVMFPLVLPASHFADRCNQRIFYGTIASILSGAIFGDHISPLSDTTIISCISTKCDVWAHVLTQAPYALLAGCISIVFGDIFIGYAIYPFEAAICIVLFLCALSVYFVCVPVDGDRVDVFTLLYRKLASKKDNQDTTRTTSITKEVSDIEHSWIQGDSSHLESGPGPGPSPSNGDLHKRIGTPAVIQREITTEI